MTLPVVERQWTDFTQGSLVPTGNNLDVAISGRGFLVVEGPSGPLYTRNGNLRLTVGGQLCTAEGYAVRGVGGGQIKMDPARAAEITADGTIRQEGQGLGQIAVVDFKNTASLTKRGGTYFVNSDPANQPAPAADAVLQQGKLENSNVPVAEAAMGLVGTMRQFEMLQRAVGVAGDMNRKTIEEVARVGS